MNGLKAKKLTESPIQTSPRLKFYSVAYHIYNFIYKVFFFFHKKYSYFLIFSPKKKERNRTGGDWFEMVPKTTRLSCLVK